jgi:hypothetical protein
MNKDAMARVGPQRDKKKKDEKEVHSNTKGTDLK